MQCFKTGRALTSSLQRDGRGDGGQVGSVLLSLYQISPSVAVPVVSPGQTKSYNHLIRFSLKEVNNSWDILSEIISDRFQTTHPSPPVARVLA